MHYFPESVRVYMKPGGTPYLAGETITLPEYADVLEAVASEGAKVFYEGWIAEKLIDEMQRPSLYSDDRSAMTLEDLAS